MDQHSLFLEAFNPGEQLRSGSVDVTMEIRELGKLHLSSGKIVACDPIHLYDLDPFLRTVSPGDYPVSISIANPVGGKYHRVAFARIFITSEIPISWELAQKARDRTIPDNDMESHGYGVDVALGCFMDLETALILREKTDRAENFHNDIFEAIEETKPEHANLTIPGFPPKNIIVFGTGFGDGLYYTYWGMDRNGELASLVTDFQVIGDGGRGNEDWAWGLR